MFDKITSRIQKLCYGLNMDYIDPVSTLILVEFMALQGEVIIGIKFLYNLAFI